jgi:hypothetical protein
VTPELSDSCRSGVTDPGYRRRFRSAYFSVAPGSQTSATEEKLTLLSLHVTDLDN